MGAGKLKHKEVHNILPSVAIAILLLTHSMYPLSNFPIPAWLESFYHMILIQLILSARKIKNSCHVALVYKEIVVAMVTLTNGET